MYNKIDNKIFYITLHITIFMTLMQLIAPIYTLYFSLRIDYIGIFLMGLILVWKFIKKERDILFQNVRNIFYENKWIVIFCLIYFIWDTINLFYANNIGFLKDKYLIWIKIIFLIYFIFVYVNLYSKENIKRNVNNILLNFGISSVILSIVAIYGYISFKFTYFVGIITPISDHNVFSVIIIIGMVTFVYAIINKEKLNYYVKFLLISIVLFIDGFAVYMSGARRNIAILMVLLIIFSIYLIYWAIVNRLSIIKILSAVLFLIIAFVSFNESTKAIYRFTESNYDNILMNAKGIKYEKQDKDKQVSKEIVRVDEQVDTIKDGSGLGLRIIIWKASIDWYKELNPVNKIIGGGASYQSDIFDNIDSPINRKVVDHYKIKDNKKGWMGPHNFLLEDLLSGGLIKATIDVLIMLVIGISLLKKFKRNKGHFFMILSLYLILFANLSMGGKFGMFGDRITWFVIMLDIIVTYSIKNEMYTKKLED